MINIREIIRRFMKYLIMVLVVGFTSYNVCPHIEVNQIVWIAVLSGIMFCILDIVTPSINLTKNE